MGQGFINFGHKGDGLPCGFFAGLALFGRFHFKRHHRLQRGPGLVDQLGRAQAVELGQGVAGQKVQDDRVGLGFGAFQGGQDGAGVGGQVGGAEDHGGVAAGQNRLWIFLIHKGLHLANEIFGGIGLAVHQHDQVVHRQQVLLVTAAPALHQGHHFRVVQVEAHVHVVDPVHALHHGGLGVAVVHRNDRRAAGLGQGDRARGQCLPGAQRLHNRPPGGHAFFGRQFFDLFGHLGPAAQRDILG